MMFLPLVILTIFIVLYVSPSENNLNYRRVRRSDSALDILHRKYANGEISEDEYLKRRSILNS
ncbi:SHOCT domain-containing protein [Clostridium kluyveri]|uniref:SHOCT domain-containing protein n=1 Tax=Clostridium kluyveri TaxID=1534 RepID=UPI00224773AE|nr:SHOCT domain-containing protein [Clostridium kluyveri]UZQ48914.1 SHOCT domain-containing protein [Clostridium kluyveri]